MRTVLIALVAAALVAAGCGGGGSGDGGGRVKVVAAFFPLADVARAVGGDRADVEDLSPPGVEPHDLELQPDQVAAIEDADVVLVLGDGFQPAVESAAKRATRRVVVLDAVKTVGDDPHVWLDPARWSGVVPLVQRAMTGADPPGRAAYEEASSGYAGDLHALDESYRSRLDGCRGRVLISAHNAFAYLAREYGLRAEGIAPPTGGSEVDPARLAHLADLVEREKVTTIFTEELVSPRVANTLARETGAKTAVLDTLEAAKQGTTYAGRMRANLDVLVRGLGCG